MTSDFHKRRAECLSWWRQLTNTEKIEVQERLRPRWKNIQLEIHSSREIQQLFEDEKGLN